MQPPKFDLTPPPDAITPTVPTPEVAPVLTKAFVDPAQANMFGEKGGVTPQARQPKAAEKEVDPTPTMSREEELAADIASLNAKADAAKQSKDVAALKKAAKAQKQAEVVAEAEAVQQDILGGASTEVVLPVTKTKAQIEAA